MSNGNGTMTAANVDVIPATNMERAALSQVELEERLFALAQRKANVYAKSALVPKEYQNNIGNVLIAQNMADRMGADVLMVMQNLYVVHGKPGWSAQFLIATFNSCGRFGAVRYQFTGTKGTENWGCIAITVEKETGELLEGTEVTMRMAKEEGWSTKAGSKWKTMPEQMLRYRAATFLIRSIAPEIGMGLRTADELEDCELQEKLRPKKLTDFTSEILGDSGSAPHDETPNDSIDDDTHAPAPEEPIAFDLAAFLGRINSAGTMLELAKIEADFTGPEATVPKLSDADEEEVKTAIRLRKSDVSKKK